MDIIRNEILRFYPAKRLIHSCWHWQNTVFYSWPRGDHQLGCYGGDWA